MTLGKAPRGHMPSGDDDHPSVDPQRKRLQALAPARPPDALAGIGQKDRPMITAQQVMTGEIEETIRFDIELHPDMGA